LGCGAALPLTGIRAGSVTANSHVRVVVPGEGALPPGATVPEPPPQDATPRSAFRMPPDDAPSMSKAGNLCSNVANRSYELHSKSAALELGDLSRNSGCGVILRNQQ